MAETRGGFNTGAMPARATSAMPQMRNGALASSRYAPTSRPGGAGRAGEMRTFAPGGRAGYGGYAGGSRQYAPAYRTQGAPMNRSGPMQAPRYPMRSFPNGGAYGGRGGGSQRAFSPPSGGGGHGGGERGRNGHH
jgi:hypothetical protein